MSSRPITKGYRMAQCKAKTASGQPCKMKALKGELYCFSHSVTTRAQQKQARRAGGLARHSQHAGDPESVNKKPRTISDVSSILDYALEETLELDNGIQRGRLLVSIAAAYVDALKVGELETQLAELMRILASREQR